MLAFRHIGPHQRSLQHRAHRQPRRKVRLLRYISHPSPLPHRDIARIGIFIASQHLQQRRLPRPIRPNQPNTVPITHSKANLLKQWHSAKTLAHTLRI